MMEKGSQGFYSNSQWRLYITIIGSAHRSLYKQVEYNKGQPWAAVAINDQNKQDKKSFLLFLFFA